MIPSFGRARWLRKSDLTLLFVFTFVVNVLLLVQPLYMLQVYDRVLASASVETLLYISLIAAVALGLLGIIDAIRAMICGRMAARLETEIGADALLGAMQGPRASIGDVQPLRDVATVRGFLAGRSLLALLDLPFAPFFIAIMYLIHPNLFWLTVCGAVVIVLLAFANQFATTNAAADASRSSLAAMLSAQSFVRNVESLKAMGMMPNILSIWGRDEGQALNAQDRLNRTNAIYAGLSRTLRMGLQIAILGYGGYLVLAGDMTAGMIFAASLIAGRALQPMDQVIGGWKGFVDTRKAWTRLSDLLQSTPADKPPTDLPDPVGNVTLENVLVFPPHGAGTDPLIKRVSAQITAGECVAVIGPSGAGKSTLMRTIIGALEVSSGTVRVDGADIRHWDRDRLGRHIGYLAQDVELLPGTVAQNISRFDPGAADRAIVEAASKAQVHDLVQRLPKGYDTLIGPAGLQLSGGQRQRIGLARAFFGSPRILILDEPNANLDAEGDLALERALLVAREDKVTVLIVTQRRAIAERAQKVMILRDGTLEDFGSRPEVYARQAHGGQGSPGTAPGHAPGNAQGSVSEEVPAVTGRFSAVLAGGRRPGHAS